MIKCTINQLSRLFKVISDPTRIKILYLLNDKKQTVTDIKDALDMSQSAISHQLKVLKDADLVRNERDGKFIYYYIADNHVYQIFNQALLHVTEDFKYEENENK